MNRILAIPSSIGRSHLTRLLLIARELRRSGAQVAFAFADPEEPLLKMEGFQVFPVADCRVDDFTVNTYAAFTRELIERCVEEELAAIRAFRPDAVLSDFRLTAAISSRILETPHISVVNGSLTDYFNLAGAMLDEEKRPVKFRIASAAVRFIQARQKKMLVGAFRAEAGKRGVKGLKSLQDFLVGDLGLIADLPKFCPLPGLPETVRYIGPLIWEGVEETVTPLPALDPGRRLIYATAGNTGGSDLLTQVVEAFGGDEHYQLVLTCGAFIDPADLPRAENAVAVRFLPGSPIASRADVVIHPGGSGTTYQAIRAGTPALVIPSNNEQRINGWLVKKHGVGIALAKGRLTAGRVREMVVRLLSDGGIQENIRRFQQGWPEADGAVVAAARISKFLASYNRIDRCLGG